MPVRMSDLTGCDGSMRVASSSGPIAARGSRRRRIVRHAVRKTSFISMCPSRRRPSLRRGHTSCCRPPSRPLGGATLTRPDPHGGECAFGCSQGERVGQCGRRYRTGTGGAARFSAGSGAHLPSVSDGSPPGTATGGLLCRPAPQNLPSHRPTCRCARRQRRLRRRGGFRGARWMIIYRLSNLGLDFRVQPGHTVCVVTARRCRCAGRFGGW